MAVDDQRLRQSLHARLAELVGAEETALLMDYLPPVGWADVATKRDLDVLRAEMAAMKAELRGEIAELRAEFKGQTTRLLFWLVPTMLAGLTLASRLG
jgi:hypothetical protein